ncbi:MAG: glutathione S-transferase family protein [Terricaulis sp.]
MLTLYYHPLSSFCHKALIALYECGAAFEPHLVNLGDPDSREAFLKLWPIGKFPVLRDSVRDRIVPESTTIIEYLAQHYPGASRLVPEDPDLARQARMHDRFFDHYIHIQMQKIIGDMLRPEGAKDAFGVAQARATILTAYGMLEREIGDKTWAMGDAFTLADCSAAPALLYANVVEPLKPAHPKAALYLDRLMERPSYARTLKEAQPYLQYYPMSARYFELYPQQRPD